MAEENESETDYGSSPFKKIPDADKQILEWTSRLELETVQLRDTSESLFKIIKENVDELSHSRKLFQAELDSRKDVNQETGTEVVSEVKSRLDQLEASSSESLQLLADNITKQMDERHREWMDRFTMNENVMFNVVQQMQDLTDAIQTLHEDMRLAGKRQALLEKRLRHESIATPESQHLNQNQTQRLRVLIPWEEVQECEMK